MKIPPLTLKLPAATAVLVWISCLTVAGPKAALAADDYFHWLTSHPSAWSYRAYENQSEVDQDVNGRVRDPRAVVYDPAMGAARMQLREATGTRDDGSGSIDQQIRHHFNAVNSGNLLFYWESYYPDAMNGFSFVTPSGSSAGGIRTHKAFQLSRGGDLTIEPRVLFQRATPPYVGMIDVRGYGNSAGYSVGRADSIAPQTREFGVLPNTWTRHWFLLDFDGNKVSYWVADDTRSPTAILHNVDLDFQVAFSGRPFDQFWFEHNSSQWRERAGDDPVYIWGRRLAILHNVQDAQSIVDRGASAGSDPAPPAPPVIVE